MYAPTITPSIEVTIGRETRLYHAFITTAPTRFDAPATVTLHTGRFPTCRASPRTQSRSAIAQMLRRGLSSWTQRAGLAAREIRGRGISARP